MRKLRVFLHEKTRSLCRAMRGIVGSTIFDCEFNFLSGRFSRKCRASVTPPEETVTPPVYMLLNGKYKSGGLI